MWAVTNLVAVVGILVALMASLIAVCVYLYLRCARFERRLVDVEHRYRMEREAWSTNRDVLVRKQNWYRQLFSATTDMVFVYGIRADGLPGKIMDVNDYACRRLGRTRETMLTLTPLDIEDVQTAAALPRYTRVELVTLSDEELLERENTFVRQFVRDIIRKRELMYERDYITRSGTRIPVEIMARAFDFEGRTLIMCVARGIAERRLAQRELRQHQRRFHDYFARSPVGVALYDAQRTLVNANLSCLKMLGAPDKAELTRFNLLDNPFLPAGAVELIGKGQTVRCEVVIDFARVRREGLFSTTRTGFAHLDLWINNLGLDDDFRPRGYMVHIQDVTPLRLAESALTEREHVIQHSQKLEAIGTLSGGIAHDFNNILTPILGYSEMIRQSVPQNSVVFEYIQQVLKASQRAKELVQQILTFSRKGDRIGSSLIRVTPLIKEVIKLVQASAPDTIKVSRVSKTRHDIVLADATQIHQILMNLCTNAVHAMRESGGILDVTVSDFLIHERARYSCSDLASGRYLRITVRDTGCGMEPEVAERIFEPFYTTKKRGEGTGMGLAVVHGIVTGLKGRITVETQPGKGTSFHVILPTVMKEEEEDDSLAATAPLLAAGSETILIVDDEPDIQHMAAELLKTLGYAPVTCGSGGEALKLFEINPAHYDLVITDQVMPEMSGLQLCRKLHAIRPDVPVILCTGFAESIPPREMELAGVTELISKPVGMREIGDSIRRCLAAAPSDTPHRPPLHPRE